MMDKVEWDYMEVTMMMMIIVIVKVNKVPGLKSMVHL
jgi:hypothetical protein